MRLAITNTVALNGGDAAIALSVRDAVRSIRPDAHIEVHEARPEVAQRYFPDVNWRGQLARLLGPRIPFSHGQEIGQQMQHARIMARLTDPDGGVASRSWRTRREQAALRDFQQIDAIISTGGTYLVEQYPLLPRIFEYEVALNLGVPLVFYTQSLGPFERDDYRRALRRIFAEARLVLLRDERSALHLRELGISEDHVQVVADAVFCEAPSGLTFPSRHSTGEPWKIGVSVRPWPVAAELSHPRVRAYIIAMAEGLSDLARTLPAEIELISTCQGIPEYWIDDSAVAQEIMNAVEPSLRSHFTVDRGFHTPTDFRERAAEFDLFIATRMHSAILALTAGTPVLPIAYEFKTTELFARLGLEEYVLDIDGLSSAALSAAARRMISALQGVREILTDGVSRERDGANRAIQLLDEALSA